MVQINKIRKRLHCCKRHAGYQTFIVTLTFMNFVRSDDSPGTLGESTDFSCLNLCAPSTVEGSCCDQIKGSSFVWQTPQGRSSVGRNHFAAISKISFLFSPPFFHRRKDVRHCQDEPPAKKQLKARPCEGLSAVQPEKQPRGRVKWKMKSFQQIVTSLPKQQACNKGDSHMFVSDKMHTTKLKSSPH